ncbi:penicillin acylase family protein [uncultured Draconibacterium sp.]|uniref:penicillin acylase family protein n=1 Tax=uncultured Draconibacterium sp. TaxID=1573823 RepID=UPI002AA8DF98|nr:penicillin acylase family protein [uncultured Draconibacterium sp.]
MKTLKRVLWGVLGFLVLAVIVGFLILQNIRTSAVPDYNEETTLSGLDQSVTILRDEHAIPHIYAETETDLYRAVGFAMAQDRLWQMDLLRRVTQGRLSEILGKDQLNTDLMMRALRIQEKSQKILATSSPEIVAALEAYSDGVNQYIEKYPLPPEFKVLQYKPEPWEPVHSINLIGYMSWDLSMGWGTEYFLHQLRVEVSDEKIAELLPDLKNHKTAIYPEFGSIKPEGTETLLSATQNLKDLGAEIFNGSNNWAVAGKKSKTGMPLLANDMHLGLFAPGIWYQMHQVVEGKINVTGVVVPGQPFVICGHNDSIAWGMTNVMVDDLDFYAEKLNEDSTKYWFDGAWRNLKIEKETIKTKEGEEFEEDLKFTHRGPMVNRFKKEKETPLSIRWLGNEMSNEIRTVFLLNRADNWSEFRDAVSTFISVSQNVVYADVKGNIGLQCSAGLPVREGSGIQIYPGDSSKYDWQGLVPFEELPYEFNPERGYVSSANNKTAPDDYPHYISHWFATPSRIDRIREMLETKEKLGINDFKAMHSDWKSKTAEQMTAIFVESLRKQTNLNETEQAAFNKLKSWDYNLTRESQAASIFEILYRRSMENLVKDELSPELFRGMSGQKMLLENLMINLLAEGKSEWTDNVMTEEVESFDDVVVLSFQETVEELTTALGNNVDEWNWGKIHSFTLSHPLGVVDILNKALKLNRGPFEVPGSYHTVCPYSYSFTNLYETVHGASHRHIYSTQNWDESETVIPTGTSGIPASDFYLDQTELYLNDHYHSDLFTKQDLEENAAFRMQLNPK